MDMADRERMLKLIGMLGSSFDGERTTAAKFIERLARDNNLTINEAIAAAHNYNASSSEKEEILGRFREMRDEAQAKERALRRELEDAKLQLAAARYAAGRSASAPARVKIADTRDILDGLARAAQIGVLTPWEQQFAEDVSARYESDYELSAKQLAKAELIVAKADRLRP
jgi:hypothetical protein